MYYTVCKYGNGRGYVPIIFEVDDMKIICERRMDEGLRTFKDDVAGTIRTIDSGGQTSDCK